MGIDKLSQAIKVEKYEVNANKITNAEIVQSESKKYLQDKVEFFKEVLWATETNREQTKDTNSILKISAEERVQLVLKLKDNYAKS